MTTSTDFNMNHAPELGPIEIEAVIENEGQKLCVSCSMCCSGIMFGNLYITEEERERLGPRAEYYYKDKQLCLRLGCKLIGSNGVCQAFETRPSGCGEYRCALLKKLNQGEIDLESAIAVTKEAKRLNGDVLKSAHQALTDDFFAPEDTKTAIQGYLRTQIVAMSGVMPIKGENLYHVGASWEAFASYLTENFVEHYTRSDYLDGMTLKGGPFDASIHSTDVGP